MPVAPYQAPPPFMPWRILTHTRDGRVRAHRQLTDKDAVAPGGEEPSTPQPECTNSVPRLLPLPIGFHRKHGNVSQGEPWGAACPVQQMRTWRQADPHPQARAFDFPPCPAVAAPGSPPVTTHCCPLPGSSGNVLPRAATPLAHWAGQGLCSSVHACLTFDPFP